MIRSVEFENGPPHKVTWANLRPSVNLPWKGKIVSQPMFKEIRIFFLSA